MDTVKIVGVSLAILLFGSAWFLNHTIDTTKATAFEQYNRIYTNTAQAEKENQERYSRLMEQE